MDKPRLRVVLKVLDAVETQIPQVKQLIEDLIEEECQNEKISVDEAIFFASLEAISPEKHFLFCSEYVNRYFIKLKSLGYNIYLRVII